MEPTLFTPQILTVSLLLLATLYFLVTEKFPLPVISLFILVGLSVGETVFGGVLALYC